MVLGAMGLSRLGTDLFPDVAFPVVVVNVPYPGASPREVEQLVTKPIEDAVVSLNGIDRLKTTSREGMSHDRSSSSSSDVDLQDAATQVARARGADALQASERGRRSRSVLALRCRRRAVLTYTLSGGGRSLPEIGPVRPRRHQACARAGRRRRLRRREGRRRARGPRASSIAPRSTRSTSRRSRSSMQLRAQNLERPGRPLRRGRSRDQRPYRSASSRTSTTSSNLIVATAGDGSSVRLSDIASRRGRLPGAPHAHSRERRARRRRSTWSSRSGTNTIAVNDAVKAKLAADRRRRSQPASRPTSSSSRPRFIQRERARGRDLDRLRRRDGDHRHPRVHARPAFDADQLGGIADERHRDVLRRCTCSTSRST